MYFDNYFVQYLDNVTPKNNSENKLIQKAQSEAQAALNLVNDLYLEITDQETRENIADLHWAIQRLIWNAVIFWKIDLYFDWHLPCPCSKCNFKLIKSSEYDGHNNQH